MSIDSLKSDYHLLARWIRPERVYPGDPEAQLADGGLPVWALVGHWLATGQDTALTAAAYRVPREATEAALAYYRLHRDVIDARLAAGVEFALDPKYIPEGAIQVDRRPPSPEDEAWALEVAREQGLLGPP